MAESKIPMESFVNGAQAPYNINDATRTGAYLIWDNSEHINYPEGYCILLVFKEAKRGYTGQIAIGLGSGKMFFRAKNENTWTSWKTVSYT